MCSGPATQADVLDVRVPIVVVLRALLALPAGVPKVLNERQTMLG